MSSVWQYIQDCSSLMYVTWRQLHEACLPCAYILDTIKTFIVFTNPFTSPANEANGRHVTVTYSPWLVFNPLSSPPASLLFPTFDFNSSNNNLIFFPPCNLSPSSLLVWANRHYHTVLLLGIARWGALMKVSYTLGCFHWALTHLIPSLLLLKPQDRPSWSFLWQLPFSQYPNRLIWAAVAEEVLHLMLMSQDTMKWMRTFHFPFLSLEMLRAGTFHW